jgi:hypothetical protein
VHRSVLFYNQISMNNRIKNSIGVTVQERLSMDSLKVLGKSVITEKFYYDMFAGRLLVGIL